MSTSLCLLNEISNFIIKNICNIYRRKYTFAVNILEEFGRSGRLHDFPNIVNGHDDGFLV